MFNHPDDRKIREFFQTVNANIFYEDERGGDVGTYSSDGTLSDTPTTGLDHPYIWVNVDSRGLVPVRNTMVANNVAGLGVTTAINRRTGEREVTGVDFLRSANNGVPPDIILGAASPNKAPTAQDIASIALNMGRVEPTQSGSLSVYVRRFLYDGVVYGDSSVDLTAVVTGLPASSQVIAIVGFDTVALDFTYSEGASRSLAYPLSSTNLFDEAAGVVTDATVIRLGAALLQSGQTSIGWASLTDIREWLRALFAAPGAFDADSIVVDADGNVVTAAGNVVTAA